MKKVLPNSENETIGTPENVSIQDAARQLGRRGGLATRDRVAGTDFYRRIGAKGGESTKRLYGQLFSEFGKRGGRPRRPALNEPMGEGDHNRKEAGRPSDLPPPPEL